MILILPGFISIARFAHLISPEKKNLRDAFVGIDASGKRCGVANLDGDLASPLGFKWGYVDNDATASISALAQADGQNVARNFEILNRLSQGKTVRRNNTAISINIDKCPRAELLGIDDLPINIGEDFEVSAYADIVAVTGNTIGDYALGDLILGKGNNLDFFLDLPVSEDAHGSSSKRMLVASSYADVVFVPKQWKGASSNELSNTVTGS